jgi:phospholipase/carboxylesterase
MAKLSGPLLPPRNGAAPEQIVVLLHGYGADGSDLIGLGTHWGQMLPDALFVAPNAPTPCAGNPFGFEWFPLAVDRIAGRIEGARNAAPVIVEFLEDLWAQTGLTAADTFLTGFSQGAMMSLHVGTALPARLKAFVAADGFPQADKPAVALIHGELDQVVDPGLSRQAAKELAAAGYDTRLHISPGIAHGISPDGLDFATAFLTGQSA